VSGFGFWISLSTFENEAQPDAAGVRSAVFFHASTARVTYASIRQGFKFDAMKSDARGGRGSVSKRGFTQIRMPRIHGSWLAISVEPVLTRSSKISIDRLDLGWRRR